VGPGAYEATAAHADSAATVILTTFSLRLLTPLFGLLFAALALNAGAAALDIPTPYIPSTRSNVDEMLRLADVKPSDVVFDLGSGDGRIVIAAAKEWGARGVGIEIDPELVKLSAANAAQAGVADRAVFRQGDVLKADLREATVVTIYLLTSLVERLQPRLYAELRPGTRVIAHDYPFAGWQPDRKVNISKTYYLYVVPARVAGRWAVEVDLPGGRRSYDLGLEQHYQEVKGGARVAGGFLPAFDARLNGERIAFVLIDEEQSYRFEGTVRDGAMQGEVRYGYGPRQSTARWQARLAVSGK
jgi:SAM-dependent methyltransferase